MSNDIKGNTALKQESEVIFEFPVINDPEKTATSRHTVYNSVHAYRGLDELQELKEASGKDFKWVASFKPERLALHETIVGISTKIRTKNEEEMRVLVSHFYKQIRFETHMMAKDMETWRNGELYNQVANAVKAIDNGEEIANMPYADKVRQAWDLVQSRIKSGDYKPSYKDGTDEKDAIIALVQDEIFNQEVSKRTAMIVNKTLTRAVQTGEIEAIQVPAPEDRFGFMMCGGAASGKSTSMPIFRKLATAAGFDCRDFAKINTDYYRSLLIDENSINPEDFSGLTHDESAMIHEKVYKRLVKLKDDGICPHTMVDQVYPAQNKIDLALANGGEAFIIGVARDVEAAIKASKERGDKTGRYVDTKALLSMHKGVAIALPQIIADNAGEDMKIEIRDNNEYISPQDKDKEPTLIFEVNLSEKKAIIKDREKLEKYILNVCINENAKNANELYDFSKAQSIDEYLKPLKDAGINIVYQEELDKKQLDNDKIIFYTQLKHRDCR